MSFVATDGDTLVDVFGAADILEVSVSAINRQMYGPNRERSRLPKPVVEPYRILSDDPGLQQFYAELLRRCGGHGVPMNLWRNSELREYKQNKKTRRKHLNLVEK